MFLIFISSHHEQEYFDEVHRVTVPKPMDGEKLGLTVQSQNGCIVVTRILGKFFFTRSKQGIRLDVGKPAVYIRLFYAQHQNTQWDLMEREQRFILFVRLHQKTTNPDFPNFSMIFFQFQQLKKKTNFFLVKNTFLSVLDQ